LAGESPTQGTVPTYITSEDMSFEARIARYQKEQGDKKV